METASWLKVPLICYQSIPNSLDLRYLSDDAWSRPKLVLFPDQIEVVKRSFPGPVYHQFNETQKAKFADFITKFEFTLASTNQLHEKEKQGLEWLKKVTSTDFGSVMPVERMVEDILNVNRNASSIPVRDGHHQVPDDVLLAAAPGCSCDIVHDFGMIMTFFDMITDIDMT